MARIGGLGFFLLLGLFPSGLYAADVVVAEGEQFRTLDAKGWKVTHQDDSYGSHTYGGVWMTHGGCLGADKDSDGAVAVHNVTIPTAGKYRVWSKYQAPPYFHYHHKVEIVQGGKMVFSHVYGTIDAPRLWSFSGEGPQLWWPWGVDHDAAEAPKTQADLAAGPAEVRLITVANSKPAGDRFVDFVLLTTEPADTYEGFKPYKVGTPFALEALAKTQLFFRFKNPTAATAQITASRSGHFQPDYGGYTAKYPAAPAAAGEWSEWSNVGPFCRLVHDEGLRFSLAGAAEFEVQFARDSAGKDLVGDLKVKDGESVVVPIDVTWNKTARVRTGREHAEEIIALSKTWKKANGGKKPKEVLFYGAFNGKEDWIPRLKDALGYNTLLPDTYEHVTRDGLHAHSHNIAEIKQFAGTLKDKDKFRVLSFGDEIGLGQIDFKDSKNQTKFRDWLKAKGVTAEQLGANPAEATLTATGNPRLVWYSNLFNEEERFGSYREMTETARQLIGPHVLTGANYSPHTLALCYGPVYQWVDIFKHNGMSMFWAEDYIFSVPEVPQILSWMFAEARCAVKYNKQPIHFYIMPHAPGQHAGFLRRNMLLSVGNGTRHIDNFWVAPPENFTENYVAWKYHDTYRTLHDAIYETGEVESLQANGKVRPARVAVVLSKATDFNESRVMVPKSEDPFAKNCPNAPAQLNQIICRKDQQMLYVALRQAQHAVDLITEDDIADGVLKDYDVVYFAGEWIDNRAVQKLDAWVQGGGVFYAAAGCGRFNQFGEPEPAMLKLLGLKDTKLTKNVVILRTLLELPLLQPIDTITLDGSSVPAVGMKQVLQPDKAKVLGTWKDGSAAVTVHEHGKGKAYAVGTLAGNSWMKTALRQTPFARGGHHTLYNPTEFAATASKLVRLGVEGRDSSRAVVCSVPGVEAVVIDHKDGHLVTLVNWTNAPIKDMEVAVRLETQPKTGRIVGQQKDVPVTFADGVCRFKMGLAEADYVLLK